MDPHYKLRFGFLRKIDGSIEGDQDKSSGCTGARYPRYGRFFCALFFGVLLYVAYKLIDANGCTKPV